MVMSSWPTVRSHVNNQTPPWVPMMPPTSSIMASATSMARRRQ